MKLGRLCALSVSLSVWLFASSVLHAGTLSNQVREELQLQLDTLASFPEAKVAGETVHALPLVAAFYEQERDYRPAWSNEQGPLPQAVALVEALEQADKEGLRPTDYHLYTIKSLLNEVRHTVGEKEAPRYIINTWLDLLLTDAFITYGSHLAEGQVDPEKIFPEWSRYPSDIDPVQLLQKALKKRRIQESLNSLLPEKNGYHHLRQALARYREIAERGGWPDIPVGPKMALGERSDRVEQLRRRLIATGDLAGTGAAPQLFDQELEEAVRHFQGRYGLDEDGVVGAKTLAEMNVPVEERIRQIIINMERLRWLPRELGKRYIYVNIAAFSVKVVEDGEDALQMRAIVGQQYLFTPVFSAMMSYLVINPYWNVPKSIVVNEMLPRIRNHPDYFYKKRIRVFSDWSDDSYEIDPASIDWSKVNEQNLEYRLRQDPGRDDELGVLKFMFPNKYSVYLHDTPEKELFKRSVRNFSHGCVRIEKPMELAVYLLKDDSDWNEERIIEAIDAGEEKIVRLPKAIPVYFLYLTAWADGKDVYFRDDIYQRDRKLIHAMP